MNPSNNNNNSRNPPANKNANSNANRDRQASAPSPKLPPSGVPFGHLPAFLPGSASLVEQLDRRIMIVLRDGRHLVGVLRSFDQFSNMVLEDTSERRVLHLKKGGDTICYYTDIQLGLYLVRGDSMVLLGEVDVTEDTDADDNADTEEEEKDETQQDDADGDMMGSGLLGGGQGQEKEVAESRKKFMKEVSLEEFEKLQEEHENDAVEDLTWEFDMDLVA